MLRTYVKQDWGYRIITDTYFSRIPTSIRTYVNITNYLQCSFLFILHTYVGRLSSIYPKQQNKKNCSPQRYVNQPTFTMGRSSIGSNSTTTSRRSSSRIAQATKEKEGKTKNTSQRGGRRKPSKVAPVKKVPIVSAGYLENHANKVIFSFCFT